MARCHAAPFPEWHGATQCHSAWHGVTPCHSWPGRRSATLGSMAVTSITAAQSIDFPVTRTTSPVGDAERAAVLQAPGFGRTMTDHMAYARWTSGAGWHDAAIKPYGPLQVDPATAIFHYGQSIFEGF